MLGASQVVLVIKNLPANAGDERETGSIPGSGRSPGGGHGNLLQYSDLQNPMVRGAWRAVVHRVIWSQIQLKWLSMYVCKVMLGRFPGLGFKGAFCFLSPGTLALDPELSWNPITLKPSCWRGEGRCSSQQASNHHHHQGSGVREAILDPPDQPGHQLSSAE